MFSLLTKDSGVALRLPDGDREKFLKRYKTVLCEQHGAIMEEYVVVPEGLLKKTRELKPYFDASYAYVSGLTPKPTKRKTPAKPKAKT